MIGTDVVKAASLLIAGKLVAIPTETVYGLAANALNHEAVSQLYTVKNRPQFNPLILHCASIEEAKKYTRKWPKNAELLAQTFWPGSISFLLPKSSLVPDLITAGSQNVVIRIPNHPLTLDLLAKLDFPLAAPSANISNTVSPTSALHVDSTIGHQIGYVLDGGTCFVGVESTIVSFENDQIAILREGGVTQEQIMEMGLDVIEIKQHTIQTPGQLKKHYATKKPLLIVDNLEQWINENPHKKPIALLYEEKNLKIANVLLSKSYVLSEIAASLFAGMRKADQTDGDVIIIEKIQQKGIGRAIADRLNRAAAR